LAGGFVVVILARPYEGGVLTLLTLGIVVVCWASHWRRLALGMVPVAVAGVAFLAVYTNSSTGKLFRLPYQENAAQYQLRRTFYWQQDHPEPQYRHPQMRNVYRWLLRDDWTPAQKWSTVLVAIARQYGGKWILSLVLSFAILSVFFARGLMRWPGVCLIAGICADSLVLFVHPHYLAPFAITLPLAATIGIASFPQFPHRSMLQAGLISVILTGSLLRLALVAYLPKPALGWGNERPALLYNLERTPDRHLVFIRYSDNHNVHDEWVYNPADFATAKVLWARWWTPEKNALVRKAYPGRKFWVYEPDSPNRSLRPYVPEDGAE
jgi:hypothetical protein